MHLITEKPVFLPDEYVQFQASIQLMQNHHQQVLQLLCTWKKEAKFVTGKFSNKYQSEELRMDSVHEVITY